MLETIKELLSKNLRKLRSGRTMAEAAELAGIPFRTYQGIDMGETWPQLQNLEAIAKAFEVDVARLFQTSEPPDPTPERALEVIAAALSRRSPPSTLLSLAGIEPDKLKRFVSAIGARPDIFEAAIMPVIQSVEASLNKAEDRTSTVTTRKSRIK